MLVDGGLVDPIPVSAVRNMGADFVIAVDLNSDLISHDYVPSKKAVVENSPSTKRNELMKRISVQYSTAGSAVKSQINKWFSSSGQ